MSKRKTSPFALRMTAMIDVIFLLLTFFLLTARFRIPEQFLPGQLPAADSSSQTASVIEPLVIVVSSTETGCRISIAGRKTVNIDDDNPTPHFAVFANELKTILQLTGRSDSDPVQLRFDNDVKWDYVAGIQNVLFGLGIEDITFGMD